MYEKEMEDSMDFFNKVSNTITSKSKDVAKKAKEIADVASLNSKINVQQDTITKTYADIGRYMYNNLINNTDEELAQLYTVINTATDEVNRLKKEIDEIKGQKKCPGCGASVPAESKFCVSCGAKIPEEEVVDEGEVREINDEETVVDSAETVAEEVIEEVTEEVKNETVE